ncbi:MAG: hypothetical protein O2912_10145 [Proteobacteria bacterium]|nr:hypothetical protein [Pseudomonadota bacterium]
MTLLGVPAVSFDKNSDKALLIYRSVTNHPPTKLKAVSWFRYERDKQKMDIRKGFVTKWIGADEENAKGLEKGELFRAVAVVPGAYALQSVIAQRNGEMRRIHAKISTQLIELAAGKVYFLNDIIFKWQLKNSRDLPDQRQINKQLAKWIYFKTEYKIDKILHLKPSVVRIIN